MTNSVTLQFKSYTFTIGKGKTPVTNAVVEQPKPEPVVPPEPFQYWGVVILLLLAVAYINGYIFWKRRSKKGV